MNVFDPFRLLPVLFAIAVLCGCSPSSEPEQAAAPDVAVTSENSADAPAEDLEELVTGMAAVGYSYAPTWAADGGRIGFISSTSGGPQVWAASPDGSGLEQLTDFEDQVGGVEWSPAGDVLAVSIAPGGGLNTQIYLLDADGGEPRQHRYVFARLGEGRRTDPYPPRRHCGGQPGRIRRQRHSADLDQY